MKRICSYILAILIAMNSYGCATQPMTTESTTTIPYKNTTTTQVADDNEMQTDDAIKTIVSLLLIGAIVVLGVGLLTCCDINFSSN